MRSLLTSPILLVILPLLAAPARSQTLTSRAIEQINAAARVRVRFASGIRVTLYAPRADSARLRYELGEARNRGGTLVVVAPPLPMADVLEIQRPIGTHTWKGAKLGAAILGVWALMLCHSDMGGGTCTSSQTRSGVAVSAFIGAGIGALIGSGSKRWETVYRAP